MSCGTNLFWIYRSYIEDKLRNQQNLLTKSNRKKDRNEEYPNELVPKDSRNEPEENELLNSFWVYRAMIENKFRNQENLLIKSNQKEDQNEEYPNKLPKDSKNEPEEYKMLSKPPQGHYVLKEKHVYYFSPTFPYNSPSAAEMVNIYKTLSNNKIGKANAPLIDCDLKHITMGDPQPESVQKETKDWKMNDRYILSHGDYSTNYSIITEKGVEKIGNGQENTNESGTSYIPWFFSVLRQAYIRPNVVSEDYEQEHGGFPNAPEIKDEVDTFGMNKESSSNFEIPPPEVLPPSPDGNFESWSSYATTFMDELDDETYEFMSVLEEDSNDIKEQPRDGLLKGGFLEKFGFEASNTLEKPFENADPLTRLPNERRSSIFYPRLNRAEFCSRFEECDQTLSDEGFFMMDPLYPDDDIDRQKDIASVVFPNVQEKSGLGFVSFLKSLLRTKDGENIHKFIKS